MDTRRIQEKINELESYLRELNTLLPQHEDAYTDLRTKRACEKTFELACETLIDVCNLIISQEGYGKPTDSKDSMQRLVKNAVISEDLGNRLRDMIGFRNLLVHRYYTVEDQQAFKYLKNEMNDFLEFIKALHTFIKEKELS